MLEEIYSVLDGSFWTIFFFYLFKWIIDWTETGTHNCKSIFNQRPKQGGWLQCNNNEDTFFPHQERAAGSGFQHTYSKWQKWKLILIYLLWIIDRVQSASIDLSILSPPDRQALLPFPVSSWEDDESILQHGSKNFDMDLLLWVMRMTIEKKFWLWPLGMKLTICKMSVRLLLTAWRRHFHLILHEGSSTKP